jgi:glycosyltransferase involved in cell wall biosynthesis
MDGTFRGAAPRMDDSTVSDMGQAATQPTGMNDPDRIAIAYVSLAVPDTSEFRNPAVHNNGNTFMRNVLIGLKSDAFADVEVFSAIPVPSFPRSRRIIVPAQRLDLAPGIIANCVPFVNITPLKQMSIGISMIWSLIRWGLRVKRNKQRVVFSFNISVPPLAFTLAAARVIRAKTIVYICDINIPGDTVPKSLLYRIDALLETGLLKFVDGCIVITDRIATDYLSGRPYIRMDGGVSTSLIEESGRLLAARRLHESQFVIVATGSLSEFNGFRDILSAFSRLKGSQYQLVLAGSGPLEGEILAAAKLDPRIEFKGFLEFHDLLALHAKADVLVSMRVTQSLNTAYAFPSKTFEYLLSGVPVITTATGHMKAEYGSHCFILEEESPQALAALLQRIECLDPAERARIGSAARQFIIDHKTWGLQHRRISEYVRTTATNPN